VFGPIVSGVSVWKSRRAIVWPRLAPFLIGGVIGVPVGGELLRWTAPANLRIAVGAIVVIFSLWNLFRPTLVPLARAGVIADGAVGVVNGVIGGATGLAGLITIIWCNLRGWPPAANRAVYGAAAPAECLRTGPWFRRTGMCAGCA